MTTGCGCAEQKNDVKPSKPEIMMKTKLIAEMQIDKIECGELYMQVMKARYIKNKAGNGTACDKDVTATIATYCNNQNGHDCNIQPKSALLPTDDPCPGVMEKQLQIDYQCSPITSFSADIQDRASRLVCNEVYNIYHTSL